MTAVPGKSRGELPPRHVPARAVLDLVGLSTRAGALVSGTNAVRTAARDGNVRQVILAADAADGQRGKLIPLLDARRIPYHICFSQEELGAASGRAPVSAVGFTNTKLAERAGELLAAIAAEPD
ncbi:MAG: ribosomal L7Ae/L30e/S12e/Gadd45 family protein [Gemmatimonadota bacterium]